MPDRNPTGTIDLSSTSAEKLFFGVCAMSKSNFSLHLSKDLNFRHTSKKIKVGSPKKILEKKNVFPKKYVELRTFDGRYKSFEHTCIGIHVICAMCILWYTVYLVLHLHNPQNLS
jgi:hypothetical protein